MKLIEKLDNLQSEIDIRICSLLKEKGVESLHSTDAVLPVTDEECMFNLDGGRYLVEIDGENLIDNGGYRYSLFVLPIEKLCKVVDSISEQPSKFRVEIINSDDKVECKYFDTNEEAYEHFINERSDIVDKRSNNTDVSISKRNEEPNRHGITDYTSLDEYSVFEDELEE